MVIVIILVNTVNHNGGVRKLRVTVKSLLKHPSHPQITVCDRKNRLVDAIGIGRKKSFGYRPFLRLKFCRNILMNLSHALFFAPDRTLSGAY